MSNTIKSCCSTNSHLETLTHSIIEFVVNFLHLTCLTHLYLAHSGRYHHLFLILRCFPQTAYHPLAAWESWWCSCSPPESRHSLRWSPDWHLYQQHIRLGTLLRCQELGCAWWLMSLQLHTYLYFKDVSDLFQGIHTPVTSGNQSPRWKITVIHRYGPLVLLSRITSTCWIFNVPLYGAVCIYINSPAGICSFLVWCMHRYYNITAVS